MAGVLGLLIFLIALVGVVGFLVAGIYNQLVSKRRLYQNAYSQIDVQLRRRHDLIPNLVESVKGYMKHERETLEAVISARNAAMQATQRAAGAPGDPRAMQQLSEAEGMLTGVLGRLFAVAEAYPDLKADRSMGQLMEELRTTENQIAFARQAFNDAVMRYNTAREVFPNNIIAGGFNFAEAQFLEEASPEVKEVPRVSF